MCSNPVLILIIVDTARRWVFAIFLFKGKQIQIRPIIYIRTFWFSQKKKKDLWQKTCFTASEICHTEVHVAVKMSKTPKYSKPKPLGVVKRIEK